MPDAEKHTCPILPLTLRLTSSARVCAECCFPGAQAYAAARKLACSWVPATHVVHAGPAGARQLARLRRAVQRAAESDGARPCRRTRVLRAARSACSVNHGRDAVKTAPPCITPQVRQRKTSVRRQQAFGLMLVHALLAYL